ncbi:hypothetical protein H1R20_g16332, partial [Candolleomyces eurysporus]
MVKEVKEHSVVLQMPDKSIKEDLLAKLPADQTNRRGITVDDSLCMKGAKDIFSISDCTATLYVPTAQLAKKDRLEKEFNKLESLDVEGDEEKVRVQKEIAVTWSKIPKIQPKPFHYSHQGILAYIGLEKAIANLPFMNGNIASGGVATFLFWCSAYLSTLFLLRNRTLFATDWLKVKLFGRDVSWE